MAVLLMASMEALPAGIIPLLCGLLRAALPMRSVLDALHCSSTSCFVAIARELVPVCMYLLNENIFCLAQHYASAAADTAALSAGASSALPSSSAADEQNPTRASAAGPATAGAAGSSAGACVPLQPGSRVLDPRSEPDTDATVVARCGAGSVVLSGSSPQAVGTGTTEPRPNSEVDITFTATRSAGGSLLLGSSREAAGFDAAPSEAVAAAILARGAAFLPQARSHAQCMLWCSNQAKYRMYRIKYRY